MQLPYFFKKIQAIGKTLNMIAIIKGNVQSGW